MKSSLKRVITALLAAVNDALQTDLTTLPLTPAKIIRAVQANRKHASLTWKFNIT